MADDEDNLPPNPTDSRRAPARPSGWHTWLFPTGSGNRYRADYFLHLAHRYRTLPAVVENPGAKAIADAAVTRADLIAAAGMRQPSGVSISWREIHAFEHAFLSLLPDDALAEEALQLVSRSSDFCGSTRAATWETAKLLETGDHPALRRHLLRVLAEAQQAQMGTRALEQTRSLAFIQACFIIVTLLAVVCLVALGLVALGHWLAPEPATAGVPASPITGRLPQIVTVAFMGALGAGISKLLRITAIPTNARPETAGVQLQQLRGQVIAAMVIGAAAACILFFAYAGGLLELAGLFPAVDCGTLDPGRSRLRQFLGEPLITCGGLGKALFWSFVAGFSERFFQDTVDRLVGRSAPPTAPPAAQ